MQNKTWVDLTDLLAWKGNFTGIQRVLYSYAVRFDAIGAHFFVYDKYNDEIIEIPLEALNFNIKNKVLTRRQKVKNVLLNKYGLLPLPIRTMTKPALRRANGLFRKLAAIIFDRKVNGLSIANSKKASILANDTVLLLGAGWNEGGLINYLSKQKQSVNYKIILHLNDILPVYHPHLFADELPPKFKSYIDQSLVIADLVTVISQASKDDVIRYCKEHDIDTPKIEVVRLGEDIHKGNLVKPKIDLLNSEFLLSVGTFEIRKNYALVYQMIKLAKSLNINIPQIVIVGSKGWLTSDLAHVIEHDPDIKDKLLLLNGISDDELGWLYANAKFTIFPSICEGWGLPIAESLVSGKFCLASGVSSMPEIGGCLVDYFSPYDAKQLLENILKYTNNPALLAQKEKQIKKNYLQTDWDNSFKQLVTIIKKHKLFI